MGNIKKYNPDYNNDTKVSAADLFLTFSRAGQAHLGSDDGVQGQSALDCEASGAVARESRTEASRHASVVEAL
jgi:hypothetical protein